MSGWTNLRELFFAECQQRIEEGCSKQSVQKLKQQVEELPEDAPATLILPVYEELMKFDIAPDFPYEEPNDLEEIEKLRPQGRQTLKTSIGQDHLYNKIHGAWLGRCIGCALGRPLETHLFMSGHDQQPGWVFVKDYLLGANAWPLDFYVPGSSTSEVGKVYNKGSTKEHIAFMESDDDIRYTVIGLKLIKNYRGDFTTSDVGRTWLWTLPYIHVCTAERQAYRNMVIKMQGHDHFSPADLVFIRRNLNPYREWIGAQIRADAFGYACPGNPELAAKLAYRDAILSHEKNGVYGEMFIAAVISAALVLDGKTGDIEKALRIGLSKIPRTSRLYESIERAMALATEVETQEELFEMLWNSFGHYNPVHTINNAALCTAALLFGQDDFEKAVTTAVACGWDTDCNGATVGSIWGALYGEDAIPSKWKEPLNDTLYSGIVDFHPIRISECARQSFESRLWLIE
ncbi:MAG: ADP-ribosylglycohydrolase family protein [Limnochordia bacterium]|nr:ADP-ribosylglycohydrolase family protein [Limnochordia bacterium]